VENLLAGIELTTLHLSARTWARITQTIYFF
jgi:hypothetical protein